MTNAIHPDRGYGADLDEHDFLVDAGKRESCLPDEASEYNLESEPPPCFGERSRCVDPLTIAALRAPVTAETAEESGAAVSSMVTHWRQRAENAETLLKAQSEVLNETKTRLRETVLECLRLESSNLALNENLTATQERCNSLLQSDRYAKYVEGKPGALPLLIELAWAIERGREKYPEGCTALSLFDEVGEVAHAINKGESEKRVRDELMDVAVVAMRLWLGEWAKEKAA